MRLRQRRVLGQVPDNYSAGDSLLIANCYSTGAVAITSTNTAEIGGIVGLNTASDGVLKISNCYYSSTATPGAVGDAGSAIPKTAAEFLSGEVTWKLNAANADGVLNPATSANRTAWHQSVTRHATTGLLQPLRRSGTAVGRVGNRSQTGTGNVCVTRAAGHYHVRLCERELEMALPAAIRFTTWGLRVAPQ